MNARWRAAASLGLKTLAAAAGLYLSVLYFRLLLLFPIPFALALAALLLGSKRERAALGLRWAISLATSAALALAFAAVFWLAATGSEHVFDMDVTAADGESDEIELRYRLHPAHFEVVTSVELRRLLEAPTPRVKATLLVSRNLGCLGALQLLRIDGVGDWQWQASGARWEGASHEPPELTEMPWPDPWWCP